MESSSCSGTQAGGRVPDASFCPKTLQKVTQLLALALHSATAGQWLSIKMGLGSCLADTEFNFFLSTALWPKIGEIQTRRAQGKKGMKTHDPAHTDGLLFSRISR